MQKHLVYGIVGLVVGLAVGFFGANSINRDAATRSTEAAAQVDPAVIGNQQSGQSAGAGMMPDVAETLSKAESEPQNFVAQMKTGDMYAQIGRFDKAAEFYKRGLILNPNDFQGNIVLANALFDSQKFEEAEGYYTKALDINPKDVNARTDLGTTFVERADPDYQRAISEFDKALEIEPKHEPTLYYLGIAYFRMGDPQNAQKALARLQEANPSSELIAKLQQNMASK